MRERRLPTPRPTTKAEDKENAKSWLARAEAEPKRREEFEKIAYQLDSSLRPRPTSSAMSSSSANDMGLARQLQSQEWDCAICGNGITPGEDEIARCYDGQGIAHLACVSLGTAPD